MNISANVNLIFKTTLYHEPRDQLGKFGKITLDKKSHSSDPLSCSILKTSHGKKILSRPVTPLCPYVHLQSIYLTKLQTLPRSVFIIKISYSSCKPPEGLDLV